MANFARNFAKNGAGVPKAQMVILKQLPNLQWKSLNSEQEAIDEWTMKKQI